MSETVDLSKISAPITTIGVVISVVFGAYIYGNGEIRDAAKEAAEERVALRNELKNEIATLERRFSEKMTTHRDGPHPSAFDLTAGERLIRRVDTLDERVRKLERGE